MDWIFQLKQAWSSVPPYAEVARENGFCTDLREAFFYNTEHGRRVGEATGDNEPEIIALQRPEEKISVEALLSSEDTLKKCGPKMQPREVDASLDP